MADRDVPTQPASTLSTAPVTTISPIHGDLNTESRLSAIGSPKESMVGAATAPTDDPVSQLVEDASSREGTLPTGHFVPVFSSGRPDFPDRDPCIDFGSTNAGDLTVRKDTPGK